MLILFPYLYFWQINKLIETAFKVKEEVKFDEEDFESVIEKVSEEGVIEEEQGDIIQSALEFTDTNVKEVLTPRNKIFALNIRGLTKEQLHEIIVETNYSRIPVYEGEFDNIIGVLHIKTYLSAYLKNPNVSIKKELQKPYFVSSDIMIDDLFTGFKKNHTHIALVRNEKNKIIGMVTMDDVLEELVSDISEPSHEKRSEMIMKWYYWLIVAICSLLSMFSPPPIWFIQASIELDWFARLAKKKNALKPRLKLSTIANYRYQRFY